MGPSVSPVHNNGVLHDPFGCPAIDTRVERRYVGIGAVMTTVGPDDQPPNHGEEEPPAECLDDRDIP